MTSVKKSTRVLLLMLFLSSTIDESKSQEGGEVPAEGIPEDVLESVAEGPAQGPAEGPAERPAEGPAEGVEEGPEDQVSESNEKSNNVNEEDDPPKGLDLIEREESKKSLELFFRRTAAPKERRGNNMLYNNGKRIDFQKK